MDPSDSAAARLAAASSPPRDARRPRPRVADRAQRQRGRVAVPSAHTPRKKAARKRRLCGRSHEAAVSAGGARQCRRAHWRPESTCEESRRTLLKEDGVRGVGHNLNARRWWRGTRQKGARAPTVRRHATAQTAQPDRQRFEAQPTRRPLAHLPRRGRCAQMAGRGLRVGAVGEAAAQHCVLLLPRAACRSRSPRRHTRPARRMLPLRSFEGSGGGPCSGQRGVRRRPAAGRGRCGDGPFAQQVCRNEKARSPPAAREPYWAQQRPPGRLGVDLKVRISYQTPSMRGGGDDVHAESSPAAEEQRPGRVEAEATARAPPRALGTMKCIVRTRPPMHSIGRDLVEELRRAG